MLNGSITSRSAPNLDAPQTITRRISCCAPRSECLDRGTADFGSPSCEQSPYLTANRVRLSVGQAIDEVKNCVLRQTIDRGQRNDRGRSVSRRGDLGRAAIYPRLSAV